MLFQILLGIVVGLSVFAVISEAVSTGVLGWFISEKKLDEFFEKNFEDYKTEFLNEGRSNRMFYGIAIGDRWLNLPYISNRPSSPLSRWHIFDMGRIPRWSKWNQKLNELWAMRSEFKVPTE